MILVGVKIMPRKEVLDSQGRATMKTLGHHEIALNDCRVGKYVELKFDKETKEEALSKSKEIAELILFNPLVETFELEVKEL
ncbi:MAG: phosphoribosylformylglycinamidine synthase subunit PurS [Bdellovibrionaceae bacterium]|jgi:phosphoribosylformylglycinamidine synthase subunit PurS|nr:phosphoribosylformylglycinamidine synthase subunit PurS [Pseudobdellovibrionaceae bacterium]